MNRVRHPVPVSGRCSLDATGETAIFKLCWSSGVQQAGV
jgi:hypothetical protein